MAFIPGLLMLATFGLERLESGLTTDAVSPTDVAKLVAAATARDAGAPARPRQLDALPTRALPSRPAVTRLPIRVQLSHRPNPEFQATRHANRV